MQADLYMKKKKRIDFLIKFQKIAIERCNTLKDSVPLSRNYILISENTFNLNKMLAEKLAVLIIVHSIKE